MGYAISIDYWMVFERVVENAEVRRFCSPKRQNPHTRHRRVGHPEPARSLNLGHPPN